jgi:hypothetical protein
MALGRRLAVLGFLGGLLAAVFGLARKSSKETGKSIPASLADVPVEAQRVASDARARATDARTKATEAATTGWQTVKEKEAALVKRLPGKGGEEDTAEAGVSGDGPEPTEAQ